MNSTQTYCWLHLHCDSQEIHLTKMELVLIEFFPKVRILNRESIWKNIPLVISPLSSFLPKVPNELCVGVYIFNWPISKKFKTFFPIKNASGLPKENIFSVKYFLSSEWFHFRNKFVHPFWNWFRLEESFGCF